MAKIPASLKIQCEDMKPYPADLKGIGIVHGENMENSGKCTARHTGIVDIINALEAKYRNE